MSVQSAEELALPCQPRIVALLMSGLVGEVSNLRRINQLFGSDPVLAGRLLALANSPAYQLVGAVRSVPQAVTLLGVPQLRLLVRRAHKGMAVRVLPGMDLAEFWRFSLMTAKLARSLAGMVHMDGSAAYAAGLLHGLGQMLLHCNQPAQTGPLDSVMGVWDPRRPRLEEQRWGYCASHTTAILFKQWQLPRELIETVRCMEHPLSFEQFEPMAGILHLALWRTRGRACGWSAHTAAIAFPSEVGVALGLDMDVVLQQDAPDWGHSGF